MTGVDARSSCAHTAFHVEAHAVSDRPVGRFGPKAGPGRAADCGGDQLLDAGAHRTLQRYPSAVSLERQFEHGGEDPGEEDRHG
jgi:hypothetical protein